jgi:hypothetical protein
LRSEGNGTEDKEMPERRRRTVAIWSGKNHEAELGDAKADVTAACSCVRLMRGEE